MRENVNFVLGKFNECEIVLGGYDFCYLFFSCNEKFLYRFNVVVYVVILKNVLYFGLVLLE